MPQAPNSTDDNGTSTEPEVTLQTPGQQVREARKEIGLLNGLVLAIMVVTLFSFIAMAGYFANHQNSFSEKSPNQPAVEVIQSEPANQPG